MVDKNRIVEILKRYPKGLKAKDIAAFIYGADRKAVNQILYSNPNLFSCNSSYEWQLLNNITPQTTSSPTYKAKAIDTTKSHVDSEVFYNYKNYYIEIKQEEYFGKSTILKIYLFKESDYIIQSDNKSIKCPFCNNKFSIYSFDCTNCGHTMHEICEKLYSEWNIDGHRYYITYRPINEYPESERQQALYNAVRSFVSESIPFTTRHYFNDVLREVHLRTLVMIYQKSLGMDKLEEEIKLEIEREKKIAFKHAVKNSLKNNKEAIVTVWKYYQKYLNYKLGSGLNHPTDFTLEFKLSDSETKTITLDYFHKLKSLFKENSKKCFDKAYKDKSMIDSKACKLYMIYMALSNQTPGIGYIDDITVSRLFGELDLSNDSIYPHIELSLKDTIEGAEVLRTYHKECNHNCEKVYLKIPLLLSNGELITRTMLGTYCDKCKKYFILDTEFRKILCEGKIQTQISFSESGNQFNGMDLSPESLLRKCGYTVNANSNITKEHRQKLLKAIIENKLYTPSKIVSHFRFLISMNNNVTSRDMSAAISKWQEDIWFLQQYYG